MVICFHDYTWVGSTYNREFFIITSFSNWSGKKIRTKLCNILASHHITANKPGISHPIKTNCHAFNQSKSSRDWILPRLTAVKTFSRTRHWLHLIPRLTLAIFSPTLVGTCMFVRVWHRKHFIPLFAEVPVFRRLTTVAHFPALLSSWQFFRVWRLHVFSRLPLAARFPALVSSCQFSEFDNCRTFSRDCWQFTFTCAHYRKIVFPRLLPIACCPVLVTESMFSRAFYRKHCHRPTIYEMLRHQSCNWVK